MIKQLLNILVYKVSLDMDCCHRSCRAEVFAGSTTYAHLLVDRWDSDGKHVFRVLLDHCNGICRAMSSTVAAVYIICVDYTDVQIDDGMSYLN